MHNKKNGILACGSWSVDHVKLIDGYPSQDTLANILTQKTGNGGSAYNLLKNLALMGVGFPLFGAGLLGHDQNGRYIMSDCARHGIDTAQLAQTANAVTSFTDVMTVQGTGRRTFFHHRGANDLFERKHIALTQSTPRFFHLGYLTLLKSLDTPDPTYGTQAAALLADAREQGCFVSADVASDSKGLFNKSVVPVLPHTDCLFVNEFEAGKITGLELAGDGGKTSFASAGQAAKGLLGMGGKQWAVVHFPEGVAAAGTNGQALLQASVLVPKTAIAGAAGAGDALAAGVLFGLYEGWDMARSLELGVCMAAVSLRDASCSGGICPWEEALRLGMAWGFGNTG